MVWLTFYPRFLNSDGPFFGHSTIENPGIMVEYEPNKGDAYDEERYDSDDGLDDKPFGRWRSRMEILRLRRDEIVGGIDIGIGEATVAAVMLCDIDGTTLNMIQRSW